ncbi:uncharacterized protein LOC135843302 isoform X2 [Planococcus citri]|uniref:uncharacterized protein LOC135843302 isoform X2 n=1 Tax=Planococcus citri TaxID=170843 RepID=UPI0031FA3ADC
MKTNSKKSHKVPFEDVKVDVLHNGVFETMNDYRKQNLFCDVTFDINGTLFPCHRLVLTIMSPYFRTMFNGNFKEASSKIVPLQDIDAEIMEIILRAIYTARIHLLPKNVYFTLKASHLFQLDAISNECVDCIMKNVASIHYLPETCSFSKIIGSTALYAKCAEAMATDILHWGKTDGFFNLSFEIMTDVLSEVSSKSSSSDDGILAIIIKWCKYNGTCSKDMKVLLQAPKFNSKTVGISAIPELVNSTKGEDGDKCAESSIPSSDLILILYLNAVDVKSGAKGWATLKLNESFDKYTLSNFRASDSPYRKMCSIGTKIYCFEVNLQIEKYTFSCYDESGGIDLQVPNVYGNSTSKEYFITSDNYDDYEYELIADAEEKKIYLFYKVSDTDIWVYDCELNSWQGDTFKVPVKGSFKLKPALYKYQDWFAVTFLDRVLYFLGCRQRYDYAYYGTPYILTIDTRTPTIKSEVAQLPSIIDLKTKEWITDLKPMNEGRAKHKLIHYNGFLYAVENSPFKKNEKYDVKLNTWIELPKLPERVQFVDADGVDMTIGFGSVINAESIRL